MRTEPELISRLARVADDIDSLVREIGPKVVRIAHLRKESVEIIDELRQLHDLEHRESETS